MSYTFTIITWALAGAGVALLIEHRNDKRPSPAWFSGWLCAVIGLGAAVARLLWMLP